MGNGRDRGEAALAILSSSVFFLLDLTFSSLRIVKRRKGMDDCTQNLVVTWRQKRRREIETFDIFRKLKEKKQKSSLQSGNFSQMRLQNMLQIEEEPANFSFKLPKQIRN